MKTEYESIVEGMDKLVELIETGWMPNQAVCQSIARVNAAVARAARSRPEDPQPDVAVG